MLASVRGQRLAAPSPSCRAGPVILSKLHGHPGRKPRDEFDSRAHHIRQSSDFGEVFGRPLKELASSLARVFEEAGTSLNRTLRRGPPKQRGQIQPKVFLVCLGVLSRLGGLHKPRRAHCRWGSGAAGSLPTVSASLLGRGARSWGTAGATCRCACYVAGDPPAGSAGSPGA